MTPWSAPVEHACVLLAAVMWDRWLGEPPSWAHPVVWMGQAIDAVRRRAPRAPGRAFAVGLGLAVGLPVVCGGLAVLMVGVPWVGPMLAVWLLTSSFAIRGLGEAGTILADRLDHGTLAEARRQLSWLCSRDPSALDASDLAAGALESVAENSSDSAIAPLFWFAIGGVPLAVAYRAINTLDAMVGYRGPLEWLGKASARLDDLANLIPARLTAGWLLLVGILDPAVSSLRGAVVLRRDHAKTESPNAGWPMAAMAGLVGVRLEKPDHYVLGAELPACDAAALRRGARLAEVAMTSGALLLIAGLGALALGRSA